ncbi:hypothetical protein DBV39_12070 [Orrella marina]|uniref:Uncharacterized protein n=1 Tax=Orrella marina TaxID=2163011 RepID=A0A2R4XKK4_9BURK|nr:hypothetical protein DBV39_12070 [Orrella marina]
MKLDASQVCFPKVGWLKTVVHREIARKSKTFIVLRQTTGKRDASVLADEGPPGISPLCHIEHITGIATG